MELTTNPLAILTFISTPAVLTNASCVLLFGTGNRYGRAVDRVHELAEMVEKSVAPRGEEVHLRIRQLEAGETRVLLIVRALTCFYTAVAGFVASTLVSLIGGILNATGSGTAVRPTLAVGFLAGCVGVLALITGAVMLAVETRYSFHVLREERAFLTSHLSKFQSSN